MLRTCITKTWAGWHGKFAWHDVWIWDMRLVCGKRDSGILDSHSKSAQAYKEADYQAILQRMEVPHNLRHGSSSSTCCSLNTNWTKLVSWANARFRSYGLSVTLNSEQRICRGSQFFRSQLTLSTRWSFAHSGPNSWASFCRFLVAASRIE